MIDKNQFAVIFLDADTVVVRNIDDAFECPGFCATVRHSERFNSGVMTITPSEDVFKDLLGSITKLSSYTGGDQGFLNAYYPDFISNPLFDPKVDYRGKKIKSMLLPTRYNADIGLYIANSNRWMLTGELKVMHFTLGSFKPWDWWCGWLIKEQARWHNFRMRLGPDANGCRHGITRLHKEVQISLPLLAPVVLALMIRGILHGWPVCLGPIAMKVPVFISNGWLQVTAVVMGYLSLLGGILLSVLIIPSAVTPWWGWFLAYEYTTFFFVIFFGKFLHVVWASRRSKSRIPTVKNTKSYPPWRGTVIYGAYLLSLFYATPVIADILHVRSFVGKILATVVGGLLANTQATMLFIKLAELWHSSS